MTDELRFERVIDAPPDVVFETFTTEGGRTPSTGRTIRVDRRVRLRPARGRRLDGQLRPLDDHLYRHRNVFEVVDRPRRLVLATTEFRPDGSSFDFAIELTFEEQDGRTLMTLTQTGFPTTELRDEHGRGVPNAFARLERAIRTREKR